MGTSFVSAAMAAELSREGKKTLFLQVEDGLADTTVPRLDLLGADLSKIKAFPVESAPVLTDEGLQKLRRSVESFRPDLVIVDPVTYFIGSKVDMHRANQVREVLKSLVDVAVEFDCAMLAIIHMNKGSAKSLYKALGSIDFQAAVRSALMAGFIEDEPERGSALFHIKSNTAKKADRAAHRTQAEAEQLPAHDGQKQHPQRMISAGNGPCIIPTG